MTLNDPYTPAFQVTTFFDAGYLRNDTRYIHGFNGILLLLLLLLLLNEYYLHAVKHKKLQEHVTNMKQKR